MATIAEQLISLANTKAAIKQSIINKGVSVADTDPFSAYPAKIGQISGGVSDEWQPNPNWWDIKKILDEDTRDYPGKVGVIMYNFNDVSIFEFLPYGMTAVATSDGAFYSYADNGQRITHNWDTTQDKDDGRGDKTRWVIYYYAADTTTATFAPSHNTFGCQCNYIAYLVLRINCTNGSDFCFEQRLLEAIDNVGYSFGGTSFYRFCYNCHSLQKLPDTLDTSSGTNFQYFCENCYSLQKLPDGLDTSNGTNFQGFCSSCHSLTKLPDGLDTSNGTNFKEFCIDCTSLQKLPDVLDTSSGTDFSSFCENCYSLTKLPDVLDMSSGTNFYKFCYYCDSLTKLPDVLDTSSGTNFQYFCNHCFSLQKLPDVLDTSSGTDFSSFCQFCGSLTKLPDTLDTSNGTNFQNFLSNCKSLQIVPAITMAANTTNYTYGYPLSNTDWLKTIYLTLPSNTNFQLSMSTRISIESFRYIADHAPDVTATPRTLTIGSTNITRCNEADPTIISDLNAKGWTIK